MTIYIQDSCAEPAYVKKAIMAMNHESFEQLSEIIEFCRSGGRSESKAKVTAKVLLKAVQANKALNNEIQHPPATQD